LAAFWLPQAACAPVSWRPGQMKEATLSYQVTVADVASRPTAVVAAATTWQEFSSPEIYGFHRDDSAQLWTEVYCLPI
jgi:hypothetical protein